MTVVRLTCGDGGIVRLPHEYFEREIFNNPEIATARSYTLRCQAKSDTLGAILDMADGESETVTITKDNFEELRNLCKELGFRGLDKELCAFRGQPGSDSVDLKEFLQLKERVTRQDKRLTELERQLNEALSWKRKAESVSREFQSLERKVEEVARVCDERNVETSRKTEQALTECAKQHDLDELARDLAQLKQSQGVVGEPVKSSGVVETKYDEGPIRKKSSSSKRGRSADKKSPKGNNDADKKRATAGREFVYDSSKSLEGIIAHLTRACGGNVHDKGIVNVTSSSVYMDDSYWHQKNAVDLGTDLAYVSKDEKDTWICYDFKDRRVIPTSYTVRTYGRRRGKRHLKSWVIEVSNDGRSWTEIDRRENNDHLNGTYEIDNFKISEVPRESFRFFRLKQTGQNHQSNYFVQITSLEIFGTLCEK